MNLTAKPRRGYMGGHANQYFKSSDAGWWSMGTGWRDASNTVHELDQKWRQRCPVGGCSLITFAVLCKSLNALEFLHFIKLQPQTLKCYCDEHVVCFCGYSAPWIRTFCFKSFGLLDTTSFRPPETWGFDQTQLNWIENICGIIFLFYFIL